MKNILKNVHVFQNSDILQVIKIIKKIHNFDKHFRFDINNFTTDIYQADENILKKCHYDKNFIRCFNKTLKSLKK